MFASVSSLGDSLSLDRAVFCESILVHRSFFFQCLISFHGSLGDSVVEDLSGAVFSVACVAAQ